MHDITAEFLRDPFRDDLDDSITRSYTYTPKRASTLKWPFKPIDHIGASIVGKTIYGDYVDSW
jgi:hypothetical protein